MQELESGSNGASSSADEGLLSTLNVYESDTVELTEEEEARLEPYDFAQDPFVVEFNDSGQDYVIELRRARLDEHNSKEYISRTIKFSKKVHDETHITTVNNYSKGNIALTKMIATRVKGYAEDEEDWLDADLILEAADPDLVGKRKSEVKLKAMDRTMRDSIVTVIDKLPIPHLKKAGEEYFGGIYRLVRPKGRIIITKGVAREWQILHQIGVVELPDGTKTKPTNVVRYFFNDADVDSVTLFDSKAIQGPVVIMDGGETREERYASVQTIDKLFGQVLQRVQGAVVDGEPFVKENKEHLDKVDFEIKRSVSLLFFNGMAVESGKAPKRSKSSSSNAPAASTN